MTNMKTQTPLPLSTAAIAALHNGSKIEAIKIVRKERKIGLKEAKEVVDEYVRGNSSLQSSLSVARTSSNGSVVRWLVIIAALALVAYFNLKKS